MFAFANNGQKEMRHVHKTNGCLASGLLILIRRSDDSTPLREQKTGGCFARRSIGAGESKST